MIIPMKKATIAVLKEDYDKVIKSLQLHSLIMIINNDSKEKTRKQSLELNESLKQRVDKTITYANNFVPKKPLFGDYKEISYNDFEQIDDKTIKDVESIENANSKISTIKTKIDELKEKIKLYSPWKNLDIDVNDMHPRKYTKMNTGYISKTNLLKFISFMDEGKYLYEIINQNYSSIPVIFAYYNEDEELVMNKVKTLGFVDFTFKDITSKVSVEINKWLEEINVLIKEKKSLENEISNLSKGIDNFEILSDQILSQQALDTVTYLETTETTIIEGWVREDTLDETEKAVSDATKYYAIEFTDPTDDDIVPTYTKNKRIVSQFETITDMFSKPNHKEKDPNAVMSVWYWIIFGMMMGDAGYGVLMIIICLLMKKLMKPKGNTLKLINVIMYSGITTIIWGVIFGSYFGFTPANKNLYWFSPMEEATKMLILSVAIGALHLMTGLVMKGLENIRNKDIPALLSKNVSWILIMGGIGAYFLIPTLGIIMAVVGVLLILIFAGFSHKSIFGKTAFGLLGLYDVTSYLSDLLSYSRIMALAMSSAAVAVVMNTLAKMVSTSFIGVIFGAIIFAGGHIFNLVLGLLSAYVHDSRLQYIEFFGKFYEGGGVDFKPLSLETKYIKEIKIQKGE